MSRRRHKRHTADSPQDLNLNLLPVLDALLKHRNVTRAGALFNLTQPASSAALARLRAAFDDELLVPVGREMRLTPKADRIRAPVSRLLELLEATLRAEEVDPRTWSGEFIIATADAVAALVLPRLVDRIDAAAPRLTLRVTNITRSSVTHLCDEDIDLIIAPPQIIDSSTLMSRDLFSDRFVVVHAKDQRPSVSSLEEYLSYGHITTVIDAPHLDGPFRGPSSTEIDWLRDAQRNVAIVPYYSLLPLLIEGTTRLALLQERLVQQLMTFLPIGFVEPPRPLPVHLQMFWNPRYDEDPKHTWLREAIFSACDVYR